MHTLPDNYKKNIDILKTNLNRGMTARQAGAVIKQFKDQLISNGLCDQDAKNFIDDMALTVIEYFTSDQYNNKVTV